MLISGSVAKNLSARCVCPKECNVTRYKVSTSYASVSQKQDRRFGMSSEFESRMQENVNKSLDTREWVVPERLEENIKETTELLRISDVKDSDQKINETIENRTNTYLSTFEKLSAPIIEKYNFIIEVAFQRMEDILRNGFIAAWNEINFNDCMSRSYELSQIISQSLDNIHQEPWRAAVRLRLEEQLLTSKRTLFNLDRVHNAYRNGVPLLNYKATLAGRFDSVYLGVLFNETTEINETYTRLRGHITRYIKHTKTLLNLTGVVIRNSETSYLKEYLKGYIADTNEYGGNSYMYISDLRLYESFVIRQPLRRVLKAKQKFLQLKGRIDALEVGIQHTYELYMSTLLSFVNKSRVFNKAHSKLYRYRDELEKTQNASKLKMAEVILSESITQMLPILSVEFMYYSQLFKHLFFNHLAIFHMLCELNNDEGSEPLLQALNITLFDLYKNANNSEKVRMKEYFKIDFRGGHEAMLQVRENLTSACENRSMSKPEANMQIIDATKHYKAYMWIKRFSSFRTKLDHFIQESRTDRDFFR